MSRGPVGAAALLLALVACGDDTTGANRTTVRVAIDWPTAREEGFVDARWVLAVSETAPQEIKAEGVFASDGSATVQYVSSCTPGDSRTGHFIDVSGRFEGVAEICWAHLEPVCSVDEQRLIVDDPAGACTPRVE